MQELPNGTVFPEHTLVEKQEFVTHAPGLTGSMGNHNERTAALPLEAEDARFRPERRGHIHGGGGFVQNQRVPLPEQQPGQGQPGGLAAGEAAPIPAAKGGAAPAPL